MSSPVNSSSPKNEHWAHHDQHGWIVYDDDDPRNAPRSQRGGMVIIRCVDWAEIEVHENPLRPPFLPITMFFNSYRGQNRERMMEELLTLQKEFALRKPAIRANASEVVRGRIQHEKDEATRRLERDARMRIRSLLEERVANSPIYSELCIKNDGKDTSYEEQLNAAEWHRQRLEILERDDFQCRDCGIMVETLEVHHCYYVIGWLPWNYHNAALISLCGECHTKRHDSGKVVVYREINGQLVRAKPKPCRRCHGVGFFPEFRHVQNGICFRCGGARFELDVDGG